MHERPAQPPSEPIPDLTDEAKLEEDAAPETSKESEPVRRSYEYRDAAGKVIGLAEAEFDGETWEIDHDLSDGQRLEGEGRRLRKFVIRGEKDGKPTEIDVLGLANPYGVDVVVADSRLDNYVYMSGKREAAVPPLDTPLDVGVMLHELGHGSQFHEERFEELKKLYGSEKSGRKKPFTYEQMREIIEAVVDAVPEAAQALDFGTMEELDRIQERKLEGLSSWKKMQAALSEQLDHRESEFSEFMADAMAGFDAEDFVRRCEEEIDQLESGLKKPSQVRPLMKTLVGELESAGFRFPPTREEAEKQPPLKIRKGSVEVEYPPLPRSMISSPEETSKLIRALFIRPDFEYDQSAMDYSPEDGTVTFRVPLDCVTEFRGYHTTVVVKASENGYDKYRQMRDRTDEVIRALEADVIARKEVVDTLGDGQRMLLKDMSADDLIALPTRMLERDATRRALQWMRKIRQTTGVDLFKAHKVEPVAKVVKKSAAATKCADSTADGMAGAEDERVEATVLEDLKDALRTYGADKMRLKPSRGGTGITPMPGGTRTPPKMR